MVGCPCDTSRLGCRTASSEVYMTVGVLLRRLANQGLCGISHVIVDEVRTAGGILRSLL